MKTAAAIAITLSASLFACAAPSPEELDSDCGDSCDGPQDSTINGLPPAEYYDLLTYAVDQESALPFRYLDTWGPRFKVDDNIHATAELYLLDDGEFYLSYEEWERVTSSESHQVAEQMLQGRWSIDGLTLLVGDVGTAQGIDLSSRAGGSPGLAFTFSRDIVGAGVEGRTMMMGLVSSSGGLFHELDKFDDGLCEPRFGEFCSYGTDCGECECGDGLCQDTFSSGEDATSCPADCPQ